MNLKEIKTYFDYNLQKTYQKQEIKSFFFISIRKTLNFSLTDFITNPEKEVTNTEYNQFIDIVNRLNKNEPIQYILGETEFHDLTFKVNESTLIPRPETIDLVNWIKDIYTDQKEILDIGTGSGCIAITLKKQLNTTNVTAIDISTNAIKTATENAKLNKVDVNFIIQDILDVSTLNKKYDIIVSNPPYVLNSEKKDMEKNVLDYEPHTALFVENNNPLLFYKKITNFATTNLNKNGLLFFEINENYGNEVAKLLKDNNFENVEIKNDIFGKPRMVKGSLKN